MAGRLGDAERHFSAESGQWGKRTGRRVTLAAGGVGLRIKCGSLWAVGSGQWAAGRTESGHRSERERLCLLTCPPMPRYNGENGCSDAGSDPLPFNCPDIALVAMFWLGRCSPRPRRPVSQCVLSLSNAASRFVRAQRIRRSSRVLSLLSRCCRALSRRDGDKG